MYQSLEIAIFYCWVRISICQDECCLIVSVQEQFLEESSKFRSKVCSCTHPVLTLVLIHVLAWIAAMDVQGRFPCLVWLDSVSSNFMLRCAQPLSGAAGKVVSLITHVSWVCTWLPFTSTVRRMSISYVQPLMSVHQMVTWWFLMQGHSLQLRVTSSWWENVVL